MPPPNTHRTAPAEVPRAPARLPVRVQNAPRTRRNPPSACGGGWLRSVSNVPDLTPSKSKECEVRNNNYTPPPKNKSKTKTEIKSKTEIKVKVKVKSQSKAKAKQDQDQIRGQVRSGQVRSAARVQGNAGAASRRRPAQRQLACRTVAGSRQPQPVADTLRPFRVCPARNSNGHGSCGPMPALAVFG
jgi:hypothetical protein